MPQPACTLCGDCNTGCNVGAKNTVLMNYLPDAHNHGADIFCQVEVQSIAPGGAGGGWTANCQLVGKDAPSDPPLAFPVTADVLVLAAGTLGTAEILLRTRALGAVPMSPAVGRRFGADGDWPVAGPRNT